MNDGIGSPASTPNPCRVDFGIHWIASLSCPFESLDVLNKWEPIKPLGPVTITLVRMVIKVVALPFNDAKSLSTMIRANSE